MKNYNAEDFIIDSVIRKVLKESDELSKDKELIRKILEKAKNATGLTYEEAAILLSVNDEKTIKEMFKIAKLVKERIYGNV